jgi:hypothetical protein
MSDAGDDAADLVAGAVDMHCHFGPDAHLERSVDCLEAAAEARDLGMAAIVLKSHDYQTAALAYAVDKVTPGIRVFGGIALDEPVGGINPHAVEVMCRIGGKVVWMPTLSSENDHRKYALPAPGLSILDAGFHRAPRVKPEVREILALAKEFDVVVETGHISFPEILALLEAATEAGVDKVVVTHAMEPLAGPRLDLAQMQEAAGLGAYIEHCAMTCSGYLAEEPPAAIAAAVRAVGAEHCILSTDYGQKKNIAPAPGMRQFLELLLDEGIGRADIDLMAKTNPARLLSL